MVQKEVKNRMERPHLNIEKQIRNKSWLSVWPCQGTQASLFCLFYWGVRACVRAWVRVCVCVCVCSVTQNCPSLCVSMDCSLPGSSVHGILQARTLERAAISFSRDLPDPGIEPTSLVSPALATRFFTTVHIVMNFYTAYNSFATTSIHV